ncbi:MAG: FAD-dependent oxidoreductase [Conexivisphaerales archaeon]
MNDDKDFCKHLIIGSGVSGFYALKELLNVDGSSRIILATRDRNYPYDRPDLSKGFMRGEILRNSVFFEKEDFYKRDNLKIMFNNGVRKLDSQRKIALLDDGTAVKFERALIATGGRPRKLGIKGEEKKGVHYLRTLEDAELIRKDVENAREPVIVGGGFIGLEVASSFVSLGKSPVIIEREQQIWSSFIDKDVSKYIKGYFEHKGVRFVMGDSVEEIEGGERVESVKTRGGRTTGSDFVLISAGIALNDEIAKEAGIKVDNGILVDEYLESSIPGIFAAGDVANIYDPSAGKRTRVEHWNMAQYAGKLAARNMAGRRETFNFLSSVWSDIFDLHIESAGQLSGYDSYLIRGEVKTYSFSIIFIKNGIASGFFSINIKKDELDALTNFVKTRFPISEHASKFRDTGADLNSLKA